MVTIFKTDVIKKEEDGQKIYAELRGMSTDAKPTTIGEKEIGNGSVFVEIDTQAMYFFDEDSQTWKGV